MNERRPLAGLLLLLLPFGILAWVVILMWAFS